MHASGRNEVGHRDLHSVDQMGRAIIGGYTTSPDFPMSAPVQPLFQGSFDAFATVVDSTGSNLEFSSYFGGSGDDRGYAVAALPGNNLLLAGTTNSGNFPNAAAIQTNLGVAADAFVLETSYEAGTIADSVAPTSGSRANPDLCPAIQRCPAEPAACPDCGYGYNLCSASNADCCMIFWG